MKIGNSVLTPGWGDVKISKYKAFEYQFEGPRFADRPIELSLRWTRKSDHAGISFTFGIKHLFWMNLNIHDRRHWNYDTDSWQTY